MNLHTIITFEVRGFLLSNGEGVCLKIERLIGQIRLPAQKGIPSRTFLRGGGGDERGKGGLDKIILRAITIYEHPSVQGCGKIYIGIAFINESGEGG